jgi:hypothetical protein
MHRHAHNSSVYNNHFLQADAELVWDAVLFVHDGPCVMHTRIFVMLFISLLAAECPF